MVQLTKEGLAGNANLDELANAFASSHVFRLPRLLHPDLMQMISLRLERSTWTARDDGEIAKEDLPDDLMPTNVLNFAANTPHFLNLIRRVTSRHEINLFDGRIYRMAPGADHFDSWHADIGTTHQDRLVGMSVNLSPRPYEGGMFRLRDEGSGELFCELSNTGQGDGIFFRISPTLKHMVTALIGDEPKIAFAGWFRTSDKDFYSKLKEVCSVARR
ncbi:MAG: hypothetical protein ACR2H4_17700 [Pyrinomonadaceae bacterium]